MTKRHFDYRETLKYLMERLNLEGRYEAEEAISALLDSEEAKAAALSATRKNLEELRAENERLRARVRRLESATREYLADLAYRQKEQQKVEARIATALASLDNEALADALAKNRPTEDNRQMWRWIVDAIADVCAAENPRFDRERFIRACETR